MESSLPFQLVAQISLGIESILLAPRYIFMLVMWLRLCGIGPVMELLVKSTVANSSPGRSERNVPGRLPVKLLNCRYRSFRLLMPAKSGKLPLRPGPPPESWSAKLKYVRSLRLDMVVGSSPDNELPSKIKVRHRVSQESENTLLAIFWILTFQM